MADGSLLSLGCAWVVQFFFFFLHCLFSLFWGSLYLEIAQSAEGEHLFGRKILYLFSRNLSTNLADDWH